MRMCFSPPSPGRRSPRLAGLALLITLAGLLAAPSAGAQEGPTVRGVLTGYAGVGYSGSAVRPFDHDFSAFIAPMGLFQVGQNVLVEGELEIELHGGHTDVILEHAEVHYLGFERLQLKAGRFHVPFGTWMHASWVNRMPSEPLLYEDAHDGAPARTPLPVLFDVGVMARTKVPLGESWNAALALWVSQGPAAVTEPEDDHAHGLVPSAHLVPGGSNTSIAPRLAYGVNFEDNNSDKMVGARLRLMSSGGLMLHLAGFRAAYDDAGDLGVQGVNVSARWRSGPGVGPLSGVDLRGEALLLRQEYLDQGVVGSTRYGGYYVQGSRRFGALEPIVRWGHLPRAGTGIGTVQHRRRQLAIGAVYWLMPSVPIKAAYEIEPDGTDAFSIQWIVGF